MSNFLVCLLLGLGYNAFVVSGYASNYRTLCDQSLVPCPYLPAPEEPPPPPPEPVPSKYKPTPPTDLTSKFLQAIIDREQLKIQEELERQKKEREMMIAELEKPKRDPLFGMRIHSWVLLLPGGLEPRKAEIPEPMFIEASTGTAYFPGEEETNSYYLGIESLWNTSNYWVNMQECSSACLNIDWNLANTKNWEHLLAGEPRELRGDQDEESAESKLRKECHLIMPPSYISPIVLTSKDYEQRYPNGVKSMAFKKTKVQLYAPFLRTDGLIESVTLYDDYEYKRPVHVYEKYQKRGDGLERSEKDLPKGSITDYYAEGRVDACKSHQYFKESKGVVDEERTLEFYNTRRMDDLLRLKMHYVYSIQDYKNRKDFLYNRYVEYTPFNEGNVQNDIHYRSIQKIVESFHRNESVPPDMDIATREFDFIDNEIRIKYHYSEGRYSQITRSFVKPPLSERGDRLVYLPHMTNSYHPDATAPPDNFDDLVDLLEVLLTAEENAVQVLRKNEIEIFNFLKGRNEEFFKPELLVSPYDPNRNQDAQAKLMDLENQLKLQMEMHDEDEINLLAPYLAKLGNVRYLTNKQALQIRQECIEDFKQCVVARANSMKKDFERCKEELLSTQKMLIQEEYLPKEEKDELFKRVKLMTTKLHAMEIRLQRHRELVPLRYRNLLEGLQSDGRLSILYDM